VSPWSAGCHLRHGSGARCFYIHDPSIHPICLFCSISTHFLFSSLLTHTLYIYIITYKQLK
jgi:hypothetical protein